MTLWEIDGAIAALVDNETGEIQDYDAFMELSMAREQKIENMALVFKNAKVMSAAIEVEIKAMKARKKVADNTIARMAKYIEQALGGEKFASPRCSISYLKSKATETDLEFVEWAREYCPEVLIEQAPKLDLVAIKEKLNDGMECPYARIVEKQNVQVR